jgi:hypothetical protein
MEKFPGLFWTYELYVCEDMSSSCYSLPVRLQNVERSLKFT